MRRVRRLTGDTVQAINPFLVLEIDEAASRDEVEVAYRALVKQWHPDRVATRTAEEQAAAADRMAEITYAYQLLTDPDVAAKHKARFDRVRASGVHVDPAPRRSGTSAEDPPPPPPTSGGDYRSTAAREFTVGRSRAGTPWTGGRTRRWFRRS